MRSKAHSLQEVEVINIRVSGSIEANHRLAAFPVKWEAEPDARSKKETKKTCSHHCLELPSIPYLNSLDLTNE